MVVLDPAVSAEAIFKMKAVPRWKRAAGKQRPQNDDPWPRKCPGASKSIQQPRRSRYWISFLPDVPGGVI